MNHDLRYQELVNKTIIEVFIERVKSTPNEVAYRVKKLGIYLERTWLNFYHFVAICAIEFKKIGLQRGEFILLLGDPCEEFTICELAAQSLGAISISLHPNYSSIEIKKILKNFNPSIFVIGNPQFLDRIIQLIEDFSSIRKIIVIDTKGLFVFNNSIIIPYEKLVNIEENQLKNSLYNFEKITKNVKPNDGLFIVYTSGVSGNPKSVLITHSKHLASTYTLIELYPILIEMNHRTVVYLPMSYLISKMVTITLPLLAPIIPHYGDGIETLNQTFFETAPTLLFTTPAYLKKLASIIFLGIENTSWLKKFIYQISLKIGEVYIKKHWNGNPQLLSKLIYFICYQLVFRPILSKIGFDKLKIIISTGLPIPPGIFKLWQIYGLNLVEIYTISEAGIVAGQKSGFPKQGDVGRPSSYLEVKISPDKEILIRNNSLFEYYWDNYELTKRVFDSDGWFHTGDLGEWTSSGNLRILGHSQDSIKNPNGEVIYLSYIENLLKSSLYINEAIILRDKKNDLFALIEINFETVSDWARKKGVQFTNYTNLTQNPEIIKFIASEIENANKNLPVNNKIKNFRILSKELIPGEEGPITYSRKINRFLAFEKYKELIEKIY